MSPKISSTSSSTNCVRRRCTVVVPSEPLHWYPLLGLIPVSAISSSFFAYIPARTCESGAPESDLVPTGFQDTYASSNYRPDSWFLASPRPRFPTSLPFKTFENWTSGGMRCAGIVSPSSSLSSPRPPVLSSDFNARRSGTRVPLATRHGNLSMLSPIPCQTSQKSICPMFTLTL